VKHSFQLALHRLARMEELALILMEESPTNVLVLLDMKEVTVKLSFYHVNRTHAKMVAHVLIT